MKLLVYPSKITPGAKLHHLCRRLGIETTNDIKSDFDLAVYWNYNADEAPDSKLIAVSKRAKVINIKCACVLKGFVDKAWEKVSGYSITIDPTKSPDRFYVRKSQLQYQSHTGETHDGKIFDRPQKLDNRYVYQKLIETGIPSRTRGILYRTLRVPVFNKTIPCLYVKDRAHRFKGKGYKSFVKIAYFKKRYISYIELEQVIKFCEIMGCEYGEIDLLRDNITGLLYAIDVNNMAGDGVFGKLPKETSNGLEDLFAETFKSEFLINLNKKL